MLNIWGIVLPHSFISLQQYHDRPESEHPTITPHNHPSMDIKPMKIIKKQYFSCPCELPIEIPKISIRMIMRIRVPLIIHLQTYSEWSESTTKTMQGI
jgi:hypothetical protein